MIRRERFCDGRLVKEVDQVNVGGAATNFRDHYIDGLHVWLLGGEQITPDAAEAFRRDWEARQA